MNRRGRPFLGGPGGSIPLSPQAPLYPLSLYANGTWTSLWTSLLSTLDQDLTGMARRGTKRPDSWNGAKRFGLRKLAFALNHRGDAPSLGRSKRKRRQAAALQSGCRRHNSKTQTQYGVFSSFRSGEWPMESWARRPCHLPRAYPKRSGRDSQTGEIAGRNACATLNGKVFG